MRTSSSKADQGPLCLLLVVSLLIGSIPLTAGVVVVSDSTQPTFTINICQPLQAIVGVTSTPLARPLAEPPNFVLRESDRLLIGSLKPLTDLVITPESPPPKASA